MQDKNGYFTINMYGWDPILKIIITTMFDGVLHYCSCFVFTGFFWCPCMAINVSIQYNGGLLPDIILLT